MEENKKRIVIDYLKKNDITFINITSDTEEILLADYLIVLTNSGVAIEGKTNTVLNEDKLLRRLGFSLPFLFDISLKLKSYDISNKIYSNIDGLVNELWK